MPPLVPIIVAWLGGLVIAHHWLVPLGASPVPLLFLALIPLVATLLYWDDRAMRLGGACALALLAGALRYQAAMPDLDSPNLAAHYNDKGWITLEGLVSGYPDRRDTRTQLTLEVETLEPADGLGPRSVTGRVLVYAPRYPEYQYGDRLRVSGLLETPPILEDFSYREYLQRKGIDSLIWRPQIEPLGVGTDRTWRRTLFALKDRAREGLGRLMPDPEAALLQGIVLGAKSSIDPELYDKYNATGTSHIIVISGANITLISGLFSLIFGRLLGKRRAYWLTLGGIAAYVTLVGADAAVVRAGLMGGLYVTALYLGRRSTAYVSLLATALLLTLFHPLSLWDVGFQLSFASTLSLILFASPLERLLERGLARVLAPEYSGRLVRGLRDAVVMTLAAQVLTLPLVAYHFGRLSLVSPLANALIVPAQAPVMVLGSFAAALSLVPPLEPLARLVAWLPWLCLAYTDAVVQWLATWPLASVEVGDNSLGWLLVYGGSLGLLGVVWWLAGARRRWRLLARVRAPAPGPRSTAALGLAAASMLLAWLALAQLPDGRLHVAFLDVGQGDAILITTPSGQQVLVDGGPSPAALTAALGDEMPFWDRSLDLVLLTHPDADHLTGLVEALERYHVGMWGDNGLAGQGSLYVGCQELLDKEGAVRQVVIAGDRLDLGQGIILEVLHPPAGGMAGGDANANSVVLRLLWGQASFLLAGDVDFEAEALLLRSGRPLAAQVLKVAHHGSAGSSGLDFLAAVAPRFAVISVGADNDFGHPAPALLARLAASGTTTVLRTDQDGTVEFVTDGQRLWLER